MKSATRIISIFALVFCFCTTTYTYASSTAKLTAKIVDENGASVPGSSVCLSFSGAKHGDGGGLTSFCREGLSDKDGLFSDSSGTLPEVGVVADKDGYYRSIQKYEFKSSTSLFNRWEPWNPTIEVVLKKKRNPVPMIMGGTGGWIHVPKQDTPIGFDFEKGDWVPPFGNGLTSDFTLTCHADIRAFADYDVRVDLSFPGNFNGIQEYYFDRNDQSLYKWPFVAPTDGYQPTIHKELNKQFPGKGISTNAKKDVNYLFRVRSEVDEKGNLISANYGKISGEIGFDAGKNGGCDFSLGYILNPDTTRNLEEDPKKNLFKRK